MSRPCAGAETRGPAFVETLFSRVRGGITMEETRRVCSMQYIVAVRASNPSYFPAQNARLSPAFSVPACRASVPNAHFL